MNFHVAGDHQQPLDLSFLFRSSVAEITDAGTAASRALLDVAYGQYCERLNAGEFVDIDDFCDGFPEIRTQLRDQIAVHHEVKDDPSVVRQLFELVWPQPGDVLLGFRIIEKLGAGAFSRVYRAAEEALGERPVALKVCWKGSDEAWILGRLMHPNIVPVHSVQQDENTGVSVICMPYLGRTTFREVIARVWSAGHRPKHARELLSDQHPSRSSADDHLPTSPIAGILKNGSYADGVAFLGLKIAEGLAYAHSNGVLHLDLKPSNVLMDSSGRPRLLDFNLASHPSRGTPRLGGTLPYMSPEQIQCFLGAADATTLNEQSDIFSLGVMLHEMLCGEVPFDCRARTTSSSAAAQALVERQLSGAKSCRWQRCEVSSSLRCIVERCLAVDRRDRFVSMADLIRSLHRELSLYRRTKRWLIVRRRGVATAVAIAMMLFAGLAVGLACRAPYAVRAYQQGLDCLANHQHSQAIEHLTRSIEHDPHRADVLFARGRAFVAGGDCFAAMQDLHAADKLHRKADQCALLGYCCNRLRSHAEAASWYDRAIEHGCRNAEVYNNLGFTHYLRGRYDSAITSLTKAVATGEHRDTALRNRAIAHYSAAMKQEREPVEAMSDIQLAMSVRPGSLHTCFRAAKIYAYACSFDEQWRDRAVQLTESSLEHGIPLAYVTSDKYLNAIFETSRLSTRSWPNGSDDLDLEAECFLCPVD